MSEIELGNFDFGRKIFYHPEKIASYKSGRRPFPTTIEIDLYDHCNHRCVFCFTEESKKEEKAILDTQVVKQRLVEARDLGTRGISFTGGGESTLHPGFSELIEFSHGLGLDNGLITNGSAITEARAIELVRFLRWVRISVGGGDRESYAAIQGIDHFDRIIRNIRTLCRVKSDRSSNLNVGVRMLILPENIHSLENLAAELSDSGANYLQVAPDQFSRDEGAFWFSKDIQEVFERASARIAGNGTRLLKSGYSVVEAGLDHPQKCYAHFFQVAVNAKGDVLFCKNSRGKDAFAIGNINENTFEEIWNGEKNRALESWIRPNNCGLFCKNMALNRSMEDILNPDPDMSPNFVN